MKESANRRRQTVFKRAHKTSKHLPGAWVGCQALSTYTMTATKAVVAGDFGFTCQDSQVYLP
jgi:hypothetical protein